MAHLLRGKQAGIQNDLSLGLGPELFVIDDVSLKIRLPGTSSNGDIDKPLWNQLADFRCCVRSRSKPSRSGHQRHQIRSWPNLCLWPEKSKLYYDTSAKVICQGPPVLCRQNHMPRLPKRFVNFLLRDQTVDFELLPSWHRHISMQ
jgi:hypothetical protein